MAACQQLILQTKKSYNKTSYELKYNIIYESLLYNKTSIDLCFGKNEVLFSSKLNHINTRYETYCLIKFHAHLNISQQLYNVNSKSMHHVLQYEYIKLYNVLHIRVMTK